MKRLVTLPILIALACSLGAQGKTDTDFGSASAYGSMTDSDSVAKDTNLPVRASSRVARRVSAYSSASTSRRGSSVYVYESAFASLSSMSSVTTASAGTTDTANGTIGAPHAVVYQVSATANTTVNVRIRWSNRSSSSNVTLKAVVNADGNDIATYTESSSSTSTSVPVTVGTSGSVTLKVTTSGIASLTAAGRASYSYSVSASVDTSAPPPPPSNCTVTNFGSACGGLSLAGVVKSLRTRRGTSNYLELTVTGASRNAVMVLLRGPKLASPIALPAGGCDLLLDVNGTGGSVNSVRGSTLRIPFRAMSGLDLNFQVGTIEFSTTGLKIATSNGVNLNCP